MEIITPVTVAKAQQVEKGHLVAFQSASPVLAILLDPSGMGMTWASLREGGKELAYYYFHETPSRLVASFGSAWELELIPTPHLTKATVQADQMIGQIVMDESGPMLILRSPQGSQQPLALNLKSWTTSGPPVSGVFGFDWRVWASEEERRRVGGRPIHEEPYRPATSSPEIPSRGYAYPPRAPGE